MEVQGSSVEASMEASLEHPKTAVEISTESLHGDFQRRSVKTSMGLHDNLRGASWTPMKVSMESPTIYGVRRQLSFSVEKTPYVSFLQLFWHSLILEL